MSYVNETWLDSLLDWIDSLFSSNKSSKVNNESVKKVVKSNMTLEEARAKFEKLINSPYLKELTRVEGFGEPENYMLKKDEKYCYGHTSACNAKTLFSENDILVNCEEFNNFSKFKCDESSTNIEKNYTVKTFYGRKDYGTYYSDNSTNKRKLRVVYYDDIKKYVLIVTTDYYYHYISKPYDNWQTLQQEVIALANIIKFEKEIEELAVKELEETAWK